MFPGGCGGGHGELSLSLFSTLSVTFCLEFSFLLSSSNGVSLDEGVVFLNIMYNPSLRLTRCQINAFELELELEPSVEKPFCFCSFTRITYDTIESVSSASLVTHA